MKSCPSHEDHSRRLEGAPGGYPVPAMAIHQGASGWSHIILETAEPTHQRIAVPDHDSLRVGTLISTLRTVAQHKGVTRDAIIAGL